MTDVESQSYPTFIIQYSKPGARDVVVGYPSPNLRTATPPYFQRPAPIINQYPHTLPHSVYIYSGHPKLPYIPVEPFNMLMIDDQLSFGDLTNNIANSLVSESLVTTALQYLLIIILQFAGNVINLYLYGALTVQLCMFFSMFIPNTDFLFVNSDLYYISFPDDPKLFKTVVYGVYLIETVYTILLTYGWGRSLLVVGQGLPIMSTISILACGPTGMLQFTFQDA